MDSTKKYCTRVLSQALEAHTMVHGHACTESAAITLMRTFAEPQKPTNVNVDDAAKPRWADMFEDDE